MVCVPFYISAAANVHENRQLFVEVFAASSESEQTGCHVRVRGLVPRVIIVPVPGIKQQCPYTALLLSYMNPAI